MAKIGTAYVDVQPDLSGFNKAIDRETSGVNSKFSKIGKAAAVGFGAGLGAAVVAIKGFADAAADSQVSQAKMVAQLKASGISFKAHAKEIDNVIQKVSQLSGLDDEDLQDSFTNIVRTTGDVNQALKLTATAADLARAKHLDVAKAGEIVAKVAGGNTGILSRYGITIDKNASSTEALATLQQKFAGQAKAYGDTTAGANDRFNVAVENLQESLGQKLLPALATVANAAANFINGLQTGEGVAGRVKTTFDTVKTTVSDLGDRFSGVADIVSTLWAKFGDNVIGVMKTVGTYIKEQVANVIQIFQGLIDFVSGVLSGDWDKAWQGIKEMFGGVMDAIVSGLKAAMALLGQVMDAGLKVLAGIWRAGWNAIKSVLDGVLSAIGSALTAAWNTFKAAASTAWNLIRDAILTPVRAARDAIPEIVTGIANRLASGWTTIKSAVAAAWEAVRSGILTPIRAARDAMGDVITGIANRLSAGWDTIKAGVAAAFEAVRSGILTPVRAARDAIGDVVTGIANRIASGLGDILKGVGQFGSDIKDKIVNAIKGGLDKLTGFVKAVIGVINKIPGVEISTKGFRTGGTTDEVPGFAEGGVTHHDALAPGSKITRPMMVVGEEAPRHPEYIVPTNPAYRNRAMGLFGELGKKLGIPGFATGGTVVRGRVSVFGPPLEAAGTTASGLSSSEPGIALNINPGTDSGWNNATTDAWVRNRTRFNVTIDGHSAVLPVIDKGPAGFTGRAIDVTGAGSRALNLNPANFPTDAIGSAVEVSGSGDANTSGGVVSTVTGILGDLIRGGPGVLLKLLPGLGDLPDWLKGTGKFVLDKATSWIKDKVAELISGGGGKPGFVSNLQDAMDLAKRMGLTITSTTGGTHVAGSYHYQGRAFDASNGVNTPQEWQFANTLLNSADKIVEMFFDPLGKYIKNGQIVPGAIGGHSDHVHVAMARGGILARDGAHVGPFVGSYKVGGTVPQDGFAYVHAGETITPAGQGAAGCPEVRVFIGDMELRDMVRVEMGERGRQTSAMFRAGGRR